MCHTPSAIMFETTLAMATIAPSARETFSIHRLS
jgi:hypothetical protein